MTATQRLGTCSNAWRHCLLALCAASAMVLFAPTRAFAQFGISSFITDDVELDTGPLEPKGDSVELLASHEINIPLGTSIMVVFREGTQLPMDPIDPAMRSHIVMTNLDDGKSVTFDGNTMQQWNLFSPYFNTGHVRLDLHGIPGATTRMAIEGGWCQRNATVTGGTPRSICGDEDNRVLSNHPYVGRIQQGIRVKSDDGRIFYMGSICTAFTIADDPYTLATASHCTRWGPANNALGQGTIIGFNWPLNAQDEETELWRFVYPELEDQYHVDARSMQRTDPYLVACSHSIFSNDHAIFAVYPNPVTGLTPYEQQMGGFEIAPPPDSPVTIDVPGYGQQENEDYEIQFAQATGTGTLLTRPCYNIGYDADTRGGQSGAPVILAGTNQAIGIHSAGGCNNDPNQCMIPRQTWCLGDMWQWEDGYKRFNAIVDVNDLLAVLEHWGEPQGEDGFRSVDCGDTWGVQDLFAVMDNWGPCPEVERLNAGQSLVDPKVQAAIETRTGVRGIALCTATDAGPCDAPNGTAACCDCDCARTVCLDQQYSYCCDIGWDEACVEAAMYYGCTQGEDCLE